MSTQGQLSLSMPFSGSLSGFVVVVFALFTASPGVVGQVNGANDFGIFEWIRKTDGGFIHPFQEYRGVTGIVATQSIPKGQLLATIPWSHILTTDEENDDSTRDPSIEGSIDCKLVKTISREFALGKDSRYAPLMMFLEDASQRPPMNHLPSNWTNQGKKLLKFITKDIPPVEPVEWLTNDFYKQCKGKRKDATSALLEVQWASTQFIGIVPLLAGMYRHRNGQYTNADSTTYKGDKVNIVATRDIQAGETIYVSHNLCEECQYRHTEYGTAGTNCNFRVCKQARWKILSDALSCVMTVIRYDM